jgi:DNA-binding MarR family transcriptional regulator
MPYEEAGPMEVHPQESVWRAFTWANALIMRRFRADLREVGLRLEEFDVLVHVYRAEGHRLALGELADSLVLADSMTRSGLTRLLDRLEGDGLLTRVLSTSDRRRFDVALTHAGVARFEGIWDAHAGGIRNYFFAPLSRRDIANLDAAFAKLIDANSSS